MEAYLDGQINGVTLLLLLAAGVLLLVAWKIR